MPPDLYKGSDKAELESAIRAAWAKRYQADTILAIRFHNEKWTRKASKEFVGNTLKSYDLQSMTVKVIVDKSPELVTIHTVTLQINHHESERLLVGEKNAGFYPVDMDRKKFTAEKKL
jgi:hypothetical protein